MLFAVLSIVAPAPVNDNSSSPVSTSGTVTAAGLVYHYERLCPGVYRLARSHARGRVELLVSGNDSGMTARSQALSGVRFAVVAGQLCSA